MSIKIDKSAFTPEELKQCEALIAKATVVDGAEGEEPNNDGAGVVKSANAEMDAFRTEMEEFKKSVEMQTFVEMAKKYAPLGKKEDELAETLYNMKKSSEANYNEFIGILDEHLAMVEKSGIFGEIGKSAKGTTTSSPVAKAEAKAKEIMKSDNCDYATAIAKAWEDPELMAEYDAEYQ